MLLPKKLRVIIILFLLIDLAISFNQYYNTPIDGDLTSIVWPAEKYRSVLNDPIGVSAISSNTKHGDTNRFFFYCNDFCILQDNSICIPISNVADFIYLLFFCIAQITYSYFYRTPFIYIYNRKTKF